MESKNKCSASRTSSRSVVTGLSAGNPDIHPLKSGVTLQAMDRPPARC